MTMVGTLLAAGVDRNIVVYDSDAATGQFTKRLVSLMKTVMRRNGGGNSASNNRGMLTDLYVSPEAMEDIRNWGVDQVDEVTRREIYTAADGSVNRVFGVNLHDLDELGDGQEYQLFYENTLSAHYAKLAMILSLLLVLIFVSAIALSCQSVKQFKSLKMIPFIVKRELVSTDGPSKALLF
jgi:hypothetical protein